MLWAMKSVSEIISACGGPSGIEAASGNRVSHWAVRKWPTIGIPERHWPLLMTLQPLTAEQIFIANKVAKAHASRSAA